MLGKVQSFVARLVISSSSLKASRRSSSSSISRMMLFIRFARMVGTSPRSILGISSADGIEKSKSMTVSRLGAPGLKSRKTKSDGGRPFGGSGISTALYLYGVVFVSNSLFRRFCPLTIDSSLNLAWSCSNRPISATGGRPIPLKPAPPAKGSVNCVARSCSNSSDVLKDQSSSSSSSASGASGSGA